MPITVLIVDDSAVVRQVISEELAQQADIKVVGVAADPIFARERMSIIWPDVVVLDIEMPRMNGLTFLRQIMAERPTPIVIFSALTEKGAAVTLDALSAGALAIITKPSIDARDLLQDSASDLITAIRRAAAAKGHLQAMSPRPLRALSTAPGVRPMPTSRRIATPMLTADAILGVTNGLSTVATTERVVAIGISTGGVQTLEALLPTLSSSCPALVIVQHMPEKFTATFAARLNGICRIEVREAKHNDRLLCGRALIAPGGKHMVVKRAPTHYYVEIVEGPLVSRHRPSVDVLFRSVAKCAGKNALGIIMTGMGDDGAIGLKEMRDAGAKTIAQDEESCVVFGMPKAAITRGATETILPLHRLPGVIEQHQTS